MAQSEQVEAVRLERVSKSYRGREALAGVGFSVRAGEVVALLGPNGAGKSTTVRLCLGLSSPERGSVALFGQDPRTPAARARLGAMQQLSALPGRLTVREQLELFALYYPRPLTVDAALEEARATHLADRLLGTLSGGERQRALFALALVGNPDLLVLDEPTAAMDAEVRRQFWLTIRRLSQRGCAVLVTTHLVEEAEAVAHRAVVLQGGRIVADATPDALRRTLSPRSVSFLGERLSLAQLGQLPGVLSASREGERFLLLCADSDAAVRALLATEGGVRDLEVKAAALSEAVATLTRPEAA